MISYFELNTFLAEYTERNTDNQYKPVAVGRYGIRTRESIYSKELAKDYSKNKVIFQNTLTVGMGSVQIDIGILTENVKYSVSPAYHTYKITGINPDYLRYCLECRNQDMFERYVKRGSRQGKTIDLGRWLTYEIPVCEAQEQKEIVSKLDHVDSLITARREQLAKLDELVKSRFIEMFGDPATNPMGWTETTVGEECYYIKDGPHKSLPDVGKGNGYPFISVRNIVNGYIDFSTAKYISEQDYLDSIKKCHPQKGDMLYSKGGTTGIAKLIDVDIEFANWVHVAVLKFSDSLNGVFFEKMLNSDYCYDQSQKLTKGVANRDLVLSAMAKIRIYKPPIESQEQFAAFVEQTDKSKFEIQQSLEKLETLKKALMQKYFG